MPCAQLSCLFIVGDDVFGWVLAGWIFVELLPELGVIRVGCALSTLCQLTIAVFFVPVCLFAILLAVSCASQFPPHKIASPSSLSFLLLVSFQGGSECHVCCQNDATVDPFCPFGYTYNTSLDVCDNGATTEPASRPFPSTCTDAIQVRL